MSRESVRAADDARIRGELEGWLGRSFAWDRRVVTVVAAERAYAPMRAPQMARRPRLTRVYLLTLDDGSQVHTCSWCGLVRRKCGTIMSHLKGCDRRPGALPEDPGPGAIVLPAHLGAVTLAEVVRILTRGSAPE